MKVNVNIDIDDKQRRRFACLIAGKQVKRLATRAEIRDFVQGAIEHATQQYDMRPIPKSERDTTVSHNFTVEELKDIDRLRKEGRDDSYIRGWLQVGRRTKR